MPNMADGVARLGALAESPIVASLAAAFADAGHELAIVGGPVRDALLGRSTNDLDFTTDARADAILRIVTPLSTAQWDVGREFGNEGEREVLGVLVCADDSHDSVPLRGSERISPMRFARW